ncbi:MAG: imidazole glycerol phosphate synthase subunit HisH [Bacteroidia bacterium]
MDIVVIKYNAGNIKSVEYAFKRIGKNVVITDDIETIQSADRVIFPGVGEASSAMKYLKERNLNKVIKELKQPVLGICLGMQLLCNYSEEGNTECLGVFNQRVKKFNVENLKAPQIGWNTIYNLKTDLFNSINEKEYMYFVHGYYAEMGSETISSTNYGIEYSSALNKNNFYGVQFHPEKSSEAGEKLLNNFLNLDK